MKLLGIDWGKNKVGLASSEGLTVSPLKVLEISSLKDGLIKISQILKKENIEQVVIGVPESGQSLFLVKKIIKELKKIITVNEEDETLSTRKALENMIELGVKRGKRQAEDSYAAVIILQNYLERHK